jgi:uncharacterized protein (DUF885 family)
VGLRRAAAVALPDALGSVSANAEGWALYAERLMDELGFLTDPAARMGYLDAQQMRAVRVIIDIGMHLQLRDPADQGVRAVPTRRALDAGARPAFFGAQRAPADFLDSEIVRYLGCPARPSATSSASGPGSPAGTRPRAHAGRGETFDLKAWHMARLSQGSLGLDDLVAELSAL